MVALAIHGLSAVWAIRLVRHPHVVVINDIEEWPIVMVMQIALINGGLQSIVCSTVSPSSVHITKSELCGCVGQSFGLTFQ